MKNRILSFLLVISLITSLFTVYSFADSGESSGVSDSSEKYAKNYLYLKTSFGDETDDYGTMPSLTNIANSYMTVKAEPDGNKYGYYNINDTDKNVYFQFEPSQSQTIGTNNLGYMILEMDFNDLGNLLSTSKFLEIHSGTGSFAPVGGRVAVSDIINIGNDGTSNYVYFKGNKNNKIYIALGEWVHFRFELSILSSTANTYNFKCYVGDKSFETTFSLGDPGVITFIRMGSTKTANQIFGLDNVALYSGPKNYQSYLDFASVKGALTMKVGAENAAVDNTQIELSYPPMLLDGEIYCPVDAIESFTDKTCPDEYVVMLDNVKYIHIDKISSAFEVDAKSYDMGLILVGDSDYFLEEDASYEEIANVMKTFVFNIPTADEFKQIVKTNTNNFDHPYILADQDKFNELRNIYTKGQKGELTNAEDVILYSYIESYVNTAANYLSTYCDTLPSGSYNGLKADKIPINNNYTRYLNNGYDNGGRVSVPSMPLVQFAFAYQMTGHLNYARAAYDYTLALGDWNHWGPAHFLNCADMAAPISISYDWLHDAYTELSSSGETSKYSKKAYDTKEISTILFTHVIIPGYIQSNNLNCPWPGSVESRYATKTSNWNAVCASGVVMSALVILEDEISVAGMTFETQKKLSSTSFENVVTPIESIGNTFIHIGLETYSDYAAKLSSMNLGTLAKYGLDQYFPDGSYVESPGYWSYGTNTLFRLIASLLSATGDDFGFMDAWGIDTTCYFAIHSESSDYKTWNFNDGSVGQQDSSFFFFVGDYYGDEELVKVRKKHLSSGKSYSIYDILYYDQTITGEPELTSEYYMIGIDAYSVRSSWDKGAIYAGIIGGQNRVSHGHMDAGSFIYHNNGKIWFHDLGADNYNMDIGYFSNFKLYRIGAEGHNMLSITSEQDTLPYGQAIGANPRIVENVSTKDGGYAVLDMSSSYGSHVLSAKRGLLFTDSRSTVVIQDEYVFNGTKTAYWYGHYNIASGYVDSVSISADGRTAFMVSGNDMIRVSIVSDNDSLKFEIMDCYTYNLDITHRTDKTTMGGATTENSRDTFRKLAIKCENVDKLNLAVVIEEVDGYEIGTSYNWTSIDDWTVNSRENSVIDDKVKADFESDSYTIGSVTLDSPDEAYKLELFGSNAYSYIGVLPTCKGQGDIDSSLVIYNKGNKSITLSDYNLITLDVDVFTENAFPDKSELGVNIENSDGTNEFISLITFTGNQLKFDNTTSGISTSWKHLTFIIDANQNTLYIYIDDIYFAKIDNFIGESALSINNFELIIPASASGDMYSSVLLDNLSVSTFSKSYDLNELSGLLSGNYSITSWTDRIEYEVISRPLAMANEEFFYTNAEIEAAIALGYDVSLLRDTVGLIKIRGVASVDTNGYKFKYISDSLVAEALGQTISFSSGNLNVRWHIDGDVHTESYKGSSIAKFKGTSDKVGAISYEIIEHEEGGISYQFYTTGWANHPGGKALTDEEMIVSSSNCNFWLVSNVPINCLFVTIDDNGKITQYNSEQKLREFLSSNNGPKEIYLCKNAEILNKSGLNLANGGKTVYLNGYTLSHRQYDVHMFNYLGSSTADFHFVGPGTLEVDTSRTMFTSSASTTDKTSPYGVVIENVRLLTNTQIGDLRVGQHRFINCSVYQTNKTKKHLFDLWNKNLTVNDGVPENLLSLTFINCEVKSEYSSASTLFSYTSTSYAEIYVKDSVIVTDGILFSASNSSIKLNINGNSSIAAGRLTAGSVEFTNVLIDNGVITNLQLDEKYIPSDAVLTSSFNSSLPYLISDKYAQVSWNDLNGATIFKEYVAQGVTPKIMSNVVCDYLNRIGGDYTYELECVSGADDVTLSPVLKSSIPLFYSMTIEDDLAMYLLIQKAEMDTKIKEIRVNGNIILPESFETVSIGDVKYNRYKISSYTPSTACDEAIISVDRIDGKTQSITISVVDYLESLLSVSDNDDEKILAVKLLGYIQSAYAYFKPEKIDEYSKITGLIKKYAEYDLVFGSLDEEYAATGMMRDVIKSARLNLSGSARIRFMLNPSYSGELTVTLNGKTDKYVIKNGLVNGHAYIEVVLSASEINDHVVLTTSAHTLTYSIHSYSTSMNNSDSKLHQLLISLSEYSSAAKKYINSK